MRQAESEKLRLSAAAVSSPVGDMQMGPSEGRRNEGVVRVRWNGSKC